jgi:hypothetical protein
MNKPLYDQDFFAWTQAQADALKRRSAHELDWDNLIEEVRDMGGRDRREVKSRLINLLLHLLKWRYQPERRGASWANSIRIQQQELPLIFEQSPSLEVYAEAALADAYSQARKSAAKQTRLPIDAFPETYPETLAEIIAADVDWDGEQEP